MVRGMAKYLVNLPAVTGRRLVIALPLIWLAVFFFLPLIETLQVSFTSARRGIPPYEPLWGIGDDGFFTNFTTGNYALLLQYWSDYFGPAFNSVKLAFFSTLVCLIFAYPMSWWIARSNEKWRTILLVLVMLPFWTSSLLRIYALIGLLNPNGFINAAGLWLGLIDAPIQMMQTDFSIYMGMVLTYLPLMILPLYAVMVRLDADLLDAAADLGGSGMQIFRTIILPLTLPGIIELPGSFAGSANSPRPLLGPEPIQRISFAILLDQNNTSEFAQFAVKIIDREGNNSNTITTSSVKINK